MRRGKALVIRCDPSKAATQHFTWILAVELARWDEYRTVVR